MSSNDISRTGGARPNAAKFASGSVDDFILSLAGSLGTAQRQMSQLSALPGPRSVAYKLPKLDFEFSMSSELVAADAQSATDTGSILRLRSADRGVARGATAIEANSLIKGTFVAVPAQGGKSPHVVKVALHRLSSHRLEIEVLITSAAGERVPGVSVEFNIDRVLSEKLNPGRKLQSTTDVQFGRVYTDQDGSSTTVLVAEDESEGIRVAVLVTAVTETQTFIFSVGEPPPTGSSRDRFPNDPSIPPQIESASITDFSVSDETVLVRWNHIAGNAGYQLRLVDANDRPAGSPQNVRPNAVSTEFSMSDDFRQGLYRVQILTRASPGATDSKWSELSKQATDLPPGPRTPAEFARRLRERRVQPDPAGRQLLDRFSDLSPSGFLVAMRDGGWNRTLAAWAMRAAFAGLTPQQVVKAVLAAWPPVMETA